MFTIKSAIYAAFGQDDQIHNIYLKNKLISLLMIDGEQESSR